MIINNDGNAASTYSMNILYIMVIINEKTLLCNLSTYQTILHIYVYIYNCISIPILWLLVEFIYLFICIHYHYIKNNRQLINWKKKRKIKWDHSHVIRCSNEKNQKNNCKANPVLFFSVFGFSSFFEFFGSFHAASTVRSIFSETQSSNEIHRLIDYGSTREISF